MKCYEAQNASEMTSRETQSLWTRQTDWSFHSAAMARSDLTKVSVEHFNDLSSKAVS